MIIISLLGALMNHIRGGFLTSLATKYYMREYNYTFQIAVTKAEKIFKSLGKNLNDLVYAIVFSYYLQIPFSAKGLLMNCFIFASMKLGRSFGWGGYIDAMISEKINHNRNDVKLLDKWFRGNDEPVLSGWAALSCRGFIWSTCLYLGFLVCTYLGFILPYSFHYIPLVGLSMGTIYLIAIKINKSIGWQLGEVLFGAALWGGVAYLLGV